MRGPGGPWGVRSLIGSTEALAWSGSGSAPGLLAVPAEADPALGEAWLAGGQPPSGLLQVEAHGPDATRIDHEAGLGDGP